MKDVRFASGIVTAVPAIAMMAGCAKQDAASTSEPMPEGDATAVPEGDASATATPTARALKG